MNAITEIHCNKYIVIKNKLCAINYLISLKRTFPRIVLESFFCSYDDMCPTLSLSSKSAAYTSCNCLVSYNCLNAKKKGNVILDFHLFFFFTACIRKWLPVSITIYQIIISTSNIPLIISRITAILLELHFFLKYSF